MTKIGTLKELNVKPGDVVEFVDGYLGMYPEYKGKRMVGRADGVSFDNGNGFCGDAYHKFRIVSRASDKQETKEVGTLVEIGAKPGDVVSDASGWEAKVVMHDRRICVIYDHWDEPEERNEHGQYRIVSRASDKPEPKVETVHLMNFHELAKGHAIVFTVKDGEPDCTSIKMEKL